MIYYFYYRLFFKVNNQEYSYVGSTTNLEATLKEHLSTLRKILNLDQDNNALAQKFYQWVFKITEIPFQDLLPYKLALFILKHNLTIADLHTEELVVKENNLDNNNYLKIQRFFIKKFQAFTQGFNCLLNNYWYLLDNDDNNYLDEDFEIACSILEIKDLKKYFRSFWWKYLTISDVIKKLAKRLNKVEIGKKYFDKFWVFYSQNYQFIQEQIKFYQDQYQKFQQINKGFEQINSSTSFKALKKSTQETNIKKDNIKKKKRLFYRLYFKLNDQEYSFVGSSINLQARIRIHLLYLRWILNLREDNHRWAQIFYQLVIMKQSLPRRRSLYYKLALFMLKHNLTIDDLYTEELQVSEDDLKNNSYQEIERNLIKKFQAFSFGFNSFSINYAYVYDQYRQGFLEDNLQIACSIINNNDLKQYFSLFWWRYLTLPNVIKKLTQRLKMTLVAKKALEKLQLFFANNKQFIEAEIKFYQDRYQDSKTLKPVNNNVKKLIPKKDNLQIKTRSYYRLYFKLADYEYSYVSSTLNLEAKLKKHFSYLRKVLNLNNDNNLWAQSFYHSVIMKQSLPKRGSLYYKLALFMLKHNLTIANLYSEELMTSKDNFNQNVNYHEIERFLIKKFKAFRFGFNNLLTNLAINHSNVTYYQKENFLIACHMINKKNFLKYLDLFAWSYLNLHDVIEQLALKLDMIKKTQEALGTFHFLYWKNIQYIKKEIKFYQDQYQKTKILNPIKI